MIVEKSKDFFDAYSDNCDGIYASGENMEAVKSDALEAIRLIKKNLPEDRWPEQIKGEFEIEWKFDVPSFLEYYGDYLSLSGMERMTGINQKQLAESAGINASTTSEIVARLEDDGYLVRTIDENDKRATVLKLTEMGKVRAEEVRSEREGFLDEVFSKLTEEEKQTLSDILDKLIEQ